MTSTRNREPKSGPLERYIAILEAVLGPPDGLNTRELEVMLGLPRTTVNRLLSALTASDLIEKGGRRGTFKLGRRLSQILQSDNAWLQLASKRLLKALAEETGETCFIARLYGATIQSIVMEPPDASVGGVLPGHVLLPHAAEYRKTWKQGYAIENGEHIGGLFTIVYPVILVPDQPPIYALGITGPAERIGSQLVPVLQEKLERTAAEFANVFSLGRKKRG
ncbi:IclR family transcriptional regulator [Mesorhizobium sanjuanii]|uniref:IclR family transcriptional regulator n=1 Tax=Mesorhizobium sanjuanii TaxID=2037900 RepID=UPI0013FDD4C9|nr:helix-turn-helix domain-containing protein [Mesorhizobium sanjuanii]